MKNKHVSIRKVVSYLNNPEYDGGFWLPNIQRPFVWSREQIERLFDSIMREYPISTLLVWRTRSGIKRRKFIDTYSQDIKLSQFQMPEDTGTKQLVLDGQQRLQSLFIGLCGSYDKEELYFHVLSGGEAGDPEDMRFKFRFLKPSKALFPWVRFRDLVFSTDMPNKQSADLVARGGMALSPEQEDQLVTNLWQIQKVFVQGEVISYQELDSVENPQAYKDNDVVEIFIRANSGGTKLGKSDLLFSLLTASWDDADEAMEELLTELNATGYAFTRDFILKTCLVLLGKGAAYDVKKFREPETKRAITEQWSRISAAIRDVRDYLYGKTYIRSDYALPSYLTLIPVIYYRYRFPREWQTTKGVDTYLLRTLLCGAFSGRPDGLIDKCVRRIDQSRQFSVTELFEVIHNDGRNLDVTEETLLNASYGSKQIHLIFNLWYRQFDYQPAYSGNQPQVDHVFPQSLMRAVKTHNPKTGNLSLMRYPAAVRDQLANCMLLTADENGFQGKCDQAPKDWFADKSDAYLDMHLIPKLPSLWELDNFEKFIEARRKLIVEKFKGLIDSHDYLQGSVSPDLTAATVEQDSPALIEDKASGVQVQAEPQDIGNFAARTDAAVLGDNQTSGTTLGMSALAEAILEKFCLRIAPPTKYIAGFRTSDNKELALERERNGIVLWSQPVELDEDAEWVPHRTYTATSPRNSNLNRKNCPALSLGNPALVWQLDDADDLLDFINWYSNAQYSPLAEEVDL